MIIFVSHSIWIILSLKSTSSLNVVTSMIMICNFFNFNDVMNMTEICYSIHIPIRSTLWKSCFSKNFEAFLVYKFSHYRHNIIYNFPDVSYNSSSLFTFFGVLFLFLQTYWHIIDHLLRILLSLNHNRTKLIASQWITSQILRRRWYLTWSQIT